MNVLFIAGGRRVELARKFKQRGHRVFSYELEKHVPISSEAQLIKGKKFGNTLEEITSFKEDVKNTIDYYDIDIALPLTEKAALYSTSIDKVIGDPVAASICYNKRTMSHMFKHISEITDYYPWPKTYPQMEKPETGYGSKNISKILAPAIQNQRYIRQQFIEGKEYTVDAYFTKNGKMIEAVPRRRLLIANGEVLESVTVDNWELQKATRLIGSKLGIVGPCCMQFIVEQYTQKPYFIECNARFGGGSTISIEAGFDMIKLLEQEYFYDGLIIFRPVWKRGFLCRRTFQDAYFKISAEEANSL